MKSHILQLAAHVLVLSAMSASAAIRYVDVDSTSPTPPYNNWATAATNIQDAVDAAVAGDQILVTNGVYQSGGRAVFGAMTNRVVVDKPVTVQSVNGAAVTLIRGYQVPGTTYGDSAIRCVYLTEGAALVGFTLTNGATQTSGDYQREQSGGGVWCESASAMVSNCVLTGNSAYSDGGGAFYCTLNNCTLTGNSAMNSGGGAMRGTLNNCIVYYNSAQNGDNYSGSVLSYSCTTPLPPGLGNISTEPQLADLSHLSAGSPCRGAGSAAYATGLDIDGELWSNPPSIGCDEYYSSMVAGPLSVSIQTAYTSVAVGFALNFTAGIGGRATANRWEFGDRTVVSNRPYASHTWAAAGDYLVAFRAYNDTFPDGVSAPVSVHVVAQPVHYVALGSANPVAPYTSWATASTNIQRAVDAASVAGALVLVTNGVYQTGGRLAFGANGAITNRVTVNKPVTVQSVNGSAATVIRGFQVPGTTNGDSAIRCVYLTTGAALVGFTLTNGATQTSGDYQRELSGGGVWCESASAMVSNCVLAGNSAYSQGGGASGGTLNNCTLVGNSAAHGRGGGAIGSTLNNCTLTANSADQGGGASFSTLSNCTLTGNSVYEGGGGAFYSTLNNCTLSGNSTTYRYGGGANGCTLNNCTLTSNSANGGGGAFGGTLNNCALTGNSAGAGGGVVGGTLNDCTLTANSASNDGGGAFYSTLNNCALSGNSASNGGGAFGGTLNNCTLTCNSAADSGGGATGGSTLNNCTLSGNSASNGGGANGGTLNNCMVYYNSAPNGDNYLYSSFSYSCTTPLPEGVGNISAEPQLADLFHLTAGSPCRGAGSAAYANGLDLDGEIWANPPSIGCDEYYPSVATGPLSVSIQAAYTNVIMGFTANFAAAIDGHVSANYWEFGDGTAVSNRPYASHSWPVAGDYLVVFRAYNDTFPNGVSATVRVHVLAQPVHYVTLGSANPVAPYTSWTTAASNMQDAVDAASVVGALVLVTNGVYQTGGRAVVGTMTNRVAVDKPVTVRSVNGAAVTVIRGFQVPDTIYGDSAVRCVYLTNGAALAGFTLTNGATQSYRSSDDLRLREYSGGGVWCESTGAVVSNCVLAGNSAGFGGGASSGTLYRCTLSGNSAAYDGGGAWGGTLNNCTLTGNSAGEYGGGVSGCALNNCIVYYNNAPNGDNYSYSVLGYSCTTPLPTNGIGNLSNPPLFVNQAGGNVRLQSNSPCINAGSNASAPAGPDLDGNPRIAGGTVDIGAYEFRSPQSLISYAWLQQYSLPFGGSADVTDADGDGLNNWQEWHTGTNPTNALSVLRLLGPTSGAPGVIVSWQSVSGLNYFLERGTDLGVQPSFLPLATDIVGQPGTTTFTDTNAVGAGPFFYRVGVQE